MGLLQRSLMARLLTYFTLLAIVPLGLIGYVAYESGRQNITDQVKAHLNSVATLKEQEIHNWVENLKDTMAWLATNPHRTNDIAVLAIHTADDPQYLTAYESLITELTRIAAMGRMSPIFLLDSTNGQIIASSDPTWEGKFRENEPYFIQGKSGNYISDIFHGLTMGQPTMVVSTPVRDTEGQLLGVLAAHANLEHLSSLMQERSGLGETGETFLVNRSNLLVTNTVFVPEGAFKKWIFGEGAMWALEGKSGVDLFLDYRDEPVIGAYRWMESRQLALIAKQDQAEAFAPVNELRNTIIIVAGLLFFIAGAVGMLASRQITNSLSRLADYARRVGEGKYTAEIEIKGKDEVASVASDVKKMVGQLLQTQEELKNAQEQLLASERLATLGQFSGSISHELRNPLGVIDSSVYYLKTKLKDADEKVQEHLARIKSSVGSSTAIIESLLNLTRMKEPQLSRLDLAAITSDAVAASKVPVKVKITRGFPEQGVLVNGDGEQLRMAFKNIIKNAHEAMDGKGTLKITVETDADGQAAVSFADNGPGIAQKDLGRIFQPLFSTKAKGIGFGLSIAKMVVDKHGGTIEAESKPKKGATIVVKLPLYVKKTKEA